MRTNPLIRSLVWSILLLAGWFYSKEDWLSLILLALSLAFVFSGCFGLQNKKNSRFYEFSFVLAFSNGISRNVLPAPEENVHTKSVRYSNRLKYRSILFLSFADQTIRFDMNGSNNCSWKAKKSETIYWLARIRQTNLSNQSSNELRLAEMCQAIIAINEQKNKKNFSILPRFRFWVLIWWFEKFPFSSSFSWLFWKEFDLKFLSTVFFRIFQLSICLSFVCPVHIWMLLDQFIAHQFAIWHPFGRRLDFWHV